MGRLRVTPKHKRKRNIPVTRIGKRAYRKRRNEALRKVARAALANPFVCAYEKYGGNEKKPTRHTAEQSYTRLGLSVDPSATEAENKRRLRQVKPEDVCAFQEPPLPEKKEMKGAMEMGSLECALMQKLIFKYHEDYERMRLDVALNPMQRTPAQLRQKISNWKRLLELRAERNAEASNSKGTKKK